MWLLILFPLGVLAVGGVLLATHISSWQRAQRAQLDPTELNFRWRQFRRRVQATSLIVLLGILLGTGQLIDGATRPRLFVGFWLSVLLLTLWVLLLAAGDALATYGFASRMRQRQQAEKLRLQWEFRQRTEPRGNAPSDDAPEA